MRHAAAIIPSDTQNLPSGSEFLSFTNSGTQTLHITTLDGDDVQGIVLLGGYMWPIRAQKVWATGTTVTNVIAYWT